MGKTAVVIIHGVGEQPPMGTVGPFTKLFAGDFFRSKPDRQSELFELRRLSTYVDDPNNSYEKELLDKAYSEFDQSYPASTVFYEFYWAFHYRDTRPALVIRWAVATLWKLYQTGQLRNLERRKRSILFAYGFSVGVFVIAVLAVSLGISLTLHSGILKVLAGALSIAFGTALPWIAAAGRPYLVGWAGDAARYFGRFADNPIERQDIRERGIKLLRRLHAPKKDGTHEYDDIVIVGHSLGSAIAYDIILNYWTEVNWDIEIDSSNSELNAALKDIEDFPEKCKSFAKDLKPKVKVPGDVPTPEGSFTWEVPDGAPTAEEYQDLQTKFVDLLHKSSRVSKHEKQSKKEGEAKEFVGNVWRIRDLVTLGCPLTYARSLLADGAGELHYRQAQRELPTCPPAKDPCKDQRGQNSFVFRYVPITPPDCVVPDHTAPFSLTRWTNIFFLQDPIGGPLRPIFGWGIRDVPVDFCEKNDAGKSRSTLSWWDRLRNLTGLAHTRYWTLKDGKPVSQDCARVLREIVHGDQAP